MFAIAAAAILSITTPAASAAAPAPAPATSAPAPAKTAKYNPRVCIVGQITGSLIRQRECRLLAQWRTDGFDPLPGK